MMWSLWLLVLFSLLLPFPSAASQTETLYVLFVGNSFTYFNEMPAMFAELSKSGGHSVVVQTIAEDGATLKDHWQNRFVRNAIRTQQWDIVVLQENSLRLLSDFESSKKYAEMLHSEIKKQGTKTLLYLTSAYKNEPHTQDKISVSYLELAQFLQATTAPVGIAFQQALKGRPGISLFALDEMHPNEKGCYLASCIFYSSIFGISPERLPRYKGKINFVRDEESYLRSIAWQTVQTTEHSIIENQRD